MDLEFHQLDLRYEELRSRSPARERRLLSSLVEVGQQTPIVVVTGVVVTGAEAPEQVVIDGYKRVRLLRKLGRDVVRATAWDLGEAEALLLEGVLCAGDEERAREKGWFLRELRDRFGLSGAELGQRFGRTESWVSRRLALVAELPEGVQRHVRAGAIGAHVAMKYLVPLARANRADSERLADAVAPLRLSTRQMAVVHAAWSGARVEMRELILKDPALVVRAHEEARRTREHPQTPAQQMLSDLGALGAIAGRVYQRTRRGELRGLLEPEREELGHMFSQTRRDVVRLLKRLDKELGNARSGHPRSDPAPA
jgi:ParB family transcriptional regulator, chromosome partitioning protein